MGGSFALALRKAGFRGEIVGVSRPATTAEAVRLGVIDRAVTLPEAQSRDLLYLAQPIQQILATLKQLRPQPHSVVTDAGSTKREITRVAQEHLPPGSFVGGHPMAGKESRGVQVADADLFRGRPYILTQPAPEWLREWILRTGARLIDMTPEEHDSLVAFTSHLPQVASTALALTSGVRPRAERVTGPALLDMTRIAQSPIDMWADIFATNSDAIVPALDEFIATLERLRDQLTTPGMADAFAEAGRAAQKLRGVTGFSRPTSS